MKARIIAVAALIGVTASIAAAGDVSLKFRLVVTDRTSTLLPVANVEGRTVGAHDAVGVAVFDDGRIAFKRFVYTDDGMEEEGTIHGYSTYEFENGDSLTAKFDGGWSAAGFEGAYEVLSGTGAYDGATGTGTFGTTTFPWEDATLFDGTFTLQVPGS
jgi:hypothetical protein